MAQEFYKKFFPPHKVQQVKRKISNFVQGNDETLFMTWEKFKDTYNFYPTHGYDTWRLISYSMRDSNLKIASSFKLHVEVDSYRRSLKMLWTTWKR